MMRIQRAVLVCASGMLVPGTGWATTVTTILSPAQAYMTVRQESGGAELQSINLNNGTVNVRGTLAADIDELAYDAVNNILYGAGGQNLYTLGNNGQTYFLSTVTGLGASSFSGLAIGSAGQLYTLATDGTIRIVDPITGLVTSSITSSTAFSDGLALDPTNAIYAGMGGSDVVAYDPLTDSTQSLGVNYASHALPNLWSLDWFSGQITTIVDTSGTAGGDGSGSGTASGTGGTGTGTGSGSKSGTGSADKTTTITDFSHLYGLFDLGARQQIIGEIGADGTIIPKNSVTFNLTGTATSFAFTGSGTGSTADTGSGTAAFTTFGTRLGTTGTGTGSGSASSRGSDGGAVVPTPSAALGGVALAGMYGGFLCIRRRSGAAARA